MKNVLNVFSKMNILWAFFFCAITKKGFGKLEPLSGHLADLRYSMSSCVLAAAKKFPTENIITFALSTCDYKNYTTSAVATDQILLNAFHQEFRWTLLVKKSDKKEPPSTFFKKTDEYIIQIRSGKEFPNILKSLLQMSSWNPHAQFIIMTTTIFSNKKDIVEYIFQELWKKKVLNAVIMLPKTDTSSILEIFSWWPYRNGSCGNRFDRAFIINTCKSGKFLRPENLFPEKIPKNMNGCPIKIRTIVWPPYVITNQNFSQQGIIKYNFTQGIEIKLANTIAEIANFQIMYTVSSVAQDWGNIYWNGSATGMMKVLLNDKVDIAFGALAALPIRNQFFDHSRAYMWESVTWCVPHSRPISKWMSLIQIFTPLIWIMILIAYITITISIWGLSNQENYESTSYQISSSCFQNVLSMLLGMTVKILPRVTKIRLLVILWVVVCLHLNTAFTSSLIRELTKPSFEPPITNVTEIIEKDFSFGLVPSVAKFFRNKAKKHYSDISSWTPCRDVKRCLDRTAYKRDFVIGIPRMYMKYASHKYVTPKGVHLLNWLKDDIVSYPIEMYMNKGFPLLKRFNSLIHRIMEAGLIVKWINDFLEDPSEMYLLDDDDESEDTTLTLSHLEGAFILLIIGLIFATLIFLLEIIFHRRKPLKIKS